MIGDQDNSPNSLGNMRLIDFGLVTDYLDKDGKHIEELSTCDASSTFAGNLAFCSKNALNFMK